MCCDCIDMYIQARHDFMEIAEALDYSVYTYTPKVEAPKEEPPLDGQMDMFGGVFRRKEDS